MKETFKIEIESKGDYTTKKEFNKEISLSERDFTALINNILDFIDNKLSGDTTSN